jgi:hypothetical protein
MLFVPKTAPFRTKEQFMAKSRILIVIFPKAITVFSFLILLALSGQAQFFGKCPANQISQGADFNLNSTNPFPNELDGFRFFGEGKLNALQLGVSTSEDVEKIFGAPLKIIRNKKTYDYDSDWQAQITFIDPIVSIKSINMPENGTRITKRFAPLPEYIGKMDYVQMLPKKKISFPEINSRDKFSSTGQYLSETNVVEMRTYNDGQGLTYWADYKDSNSPFQGNFKWIEYQIPHLVQCKMYAEQN